ncbi:hypothetical protein [Pseudonocardia sp. KRD291]|uniref:hypothetical protein n=1 Tax=Pseudonocardia sp. KRD291 TaxID=2792007 RepID=UPI001C49D767|nr:hypothetical protein [Pseudonocardia sp. KRD291]MBW0101172.1 hypothetical protein [Pseudonocardia sp. KRD291]
MSVVLVFAGLAAVLVVMGELGRRHAASLGLVPGMPDEHQEHRITVIRRGAIVCLAVGVVFALLAVAAPFI